MTSQALQEICEGIRMCNWQEAVIVAKAALEQADRLQESTVFGASPELSERAQRIEQTFKAFG